jgi:hypothetical protein
MSMEQGSRTGVAKPNEMILSVPDDARTEDPVEVTFPFMRGTRGGSFQSLYWESWHVHADSGVALTVEIRSEKGDVDRRAFRLE